MAELIRQWIDSRLERPNLVWHEWGRAAFIGPLAGEALDFLAGSSEARACLEWVDEQTGHQCTLQQAYVALELAGELSSSVPQAVRKANWGFESILAWARREQEDEGPRHPMEVTCPHCGALISGVSSDDDSPPLVGAIMICTVCVGFGRFDAQMALVAVSEEELAGFDAEFRAGLEAAQSTLRQAQALVVTGQKRWPKGGDA